MVNNLLLSSAVKKNKNHNYSKFFLLAFVALANMQNSLTAQYSGTISVPNGTFANLGVLIDSLNQYGLNGALTVNFTATQTAPTLGYQLGSAALNATMSATNTLTFNGGTIDAYTGGTRVGTAITFGTSTTYGSNDAIFVVKGTDFVRFTNMNFNENSANTANTSGMENAIAFHNLAGTTGAMDGCQNIQITGCNFNMNDFASSNQYVIYAVNTLYSATTNLIWSANGDRHRDFTINNCNFNNGMSHIMIKGSYDNLSTFRYNGEGTVRNVVVSNSNFRRIGGTSVQHAGINLFGVDTLDVFNNILDIDSMQNTTCFGVNNNNCGGYGRVYNNEVTFKRNASGTNTLVAFVNILDALGDNRPSTSTAITRKNKLFIGFHNTTLITPTSSNSNTFINSGARSIIASTNLNQPSLNIVDSNTVIGQTMIGTGQFAYTLTSGYIGQTNIIKDNIFKNFTRNGVSGVTYGIFTNGNYINEIYNNLIDSIRYTPPTTPTTTLSSTMYGIVNQNTQTTLPGGYAKVYNNTISNLNYSQPSSSTANLIGGISLLGFNDSVFNNKVHNVSMTLTSTGGGNVYGLAALNHSTTYTPMNIYNNVIDSLTMANNGTAQATAFVYGIRHQSTGTINIFNNFIGELYNRNANNTNSVVGISNSSSGTLNLMNNSIQFGRLAAVTSTGTVFGGTGIDFNTGGTNLKNNIINIKGTPGATGGSFAAVRRATTGTTGVKPANFSGNNNTYDVNTNNNNYIYAEGTTAASLVNAHYINSSATNPVGSFETQASFNSSCGVYKRFMQGEASTFNEDILATAHGSVANAFTPTGSSLSESSGEFIAATAIDLAGSSRGANFDRGALQFSGTAIDLSGPTITFTPRGNVNCTNVAVTIDAEITDFTGVNTTAGTKPRLYYRKTTDPDTFVSANNNSAPGWKFVEATNASSPFTFTYDWTKFATSPVVNDTITYFFAAQDIVGTPNVSTNQTTLVPSTSCPSSVNIAATAGLTNATSPFRFLFDVAPTIDFKVAKNPICSGNADTIKATLILSAAAAVGTTTTAGSLAGQTPFMGGWGGNKNQFLIRASELQALGLGAGAINSIELFPTTSGTTYEGFQIWMGNTSQADMSAAFVDTLSMTKVYEATAADAAYTPTASAWNVFTVGTTPAVPLGSPVSPSFTWNGTSNLVICFSWSENPLAFTSTASNCEYHTASFVASRKSQADQVTMDGMLGQTASAITTASFRPNFKINGNKAPAANPTTGYAWSPSGLGTAQTIFPFPSITPISTYKVTVTDLNGCQYSDSININVDTLPKRLQVFNSFQCGAGVPPTAFKVRDSNAYISPNIAWYASLAATTPLQIGLDTIYTSTVGSTTTMFVSVQSPAGCWSPRVPITLTVNISDSILARANGVRDTIRVCSGSPVNLTAVNVQMPSITKSFDTFTWTSNDPNSGIGSPVVTTNGNHSFTPVIGGNYQLYVNAKDTGSGCSAVDTIKFSVQENPFAGASKEITTVPNPVCIGTNVTHTFFMSQPSSVPPTGYCASNAGNDEDEEIDSVKLLVISNASGCGGSAVGGTLTGSQGTATGTASRYADYTASAVPIADLNAGTAYPITVKTGSYDATCANTSFANSAKVFVDWNADGDFADAGEESLLYNNLTGPQTTTINLTVPANAPIGKRRLRVSVRETAATAITPCNVGSWGETEDYIINVKAVPAATLFSWTSNQTGATVLGTSNPLVHALPAANTIYTLQLTNGVCIDSARDTITNAVPPLATSSIAGPSSACFGDQLRLSTNTTGACTPYTYNWFVLGGTGGNFTAVGSLNNDTILFNPTGATGARSIRVVVTDPFGAKDSTTHTISYNNPTPTAIIDDTVCGVQAGTLSATATPATDILRWYASPTSFEALAVGSSFTTPPVSANTKFYVRQFTSATDSANPFTSSTFGNATLQQGIRMNVTKKLILTHADIYPFGAPNSSGTLSVELRDNFGTPLGSVNNIPFSYNTGGTAATTAATSTPVTIPLGILVQPGTGYDLVITAISGASLAHGNVGTAFPYSTTTGSLSVTAGRTAFGTTGFTRYNFFNLKTEEGCWGGPVTDSVLFIPPPAITLSRKIDSVCSLGSTTPVTLTAPSPLSTYNTYVWTPNTNITGTSATGYTFSEPNPGNYSYILTGTQTSGQQCVNRDTFTFKVKAIPPVITRTPATPSVDICNGTIQQLEALGFRTTDQVLGTATTAGAGAGQSPFMGGWGGTKSQFIIRASELPSGGTPRTLKAISMTATTSGTTYEGMQMYVGHTTLTDFTTVVDINPATLTRVYEANAALAAYTPTVGLNTFTFGTKPATPLGSAVSDNFLWDGTSNIVVFTSWSENPTAATSTASNFEYSATSFVASMRRQADNLSMADMASPTAGGTSSSASFRPNMTLRFEDGAPITWSPTTSLFTNTIASIPYTGTNSDTVYARPVDTIKYFVTATFPNGCTRIDSLTLNVKDTVTITTQPDSFKAFCQGDTLKLCVSAASTSPMTYQWKKNGLNISTGGNASAGTSCLSIVNATQADSGAYEVEISTGTPCGAKTSTSSIVKVRLPIAITTQPKDTTVCVGAPFCLSAAAMNDSSRVWTQLTGANTGTNNTLCISSSVYADSGRYFISYIPQTPCPVKNSDTVRVRVLPPALIVADPAALTTLCIGDSVTLKATHTGALSFQWLKNGSPISGATTDSLNVKANTQSDSGEYRLVVYSPTGCTNDTTTVNTGVIKINLPVNITVQPLAKTFVCQNSPFTASVAASNTSGYEWEKNTTTISAATNATFNTITSAQPSDAGVYRVLVKGIAPCPNVYSTNDTLEVTTLAAITTPPTAFQVCEDQSISITGAASNVASYQWLRNGVAISPNGNVQTYTKGGNPATMSDSGMYRLVALSNPAGATTCKADTSVAVLGAVVRKIQITTQPLANAFVCQNSAFNTSIVAQNVTGYQWRKGASNVSTGTGGTTANYSIASTQPADADVYSVVMTGNTPCPSVTSTNNTLAVTTLAAITTPPAAFQVCEDQFINITGAASNAASYQWLRNGVAISPNGNVQTYTKGGSPATMADSGMYRLVALSNNAGATTCKADTSAAVLGAVVRKIIITTQPPVFSYGCINANFSMNIVAQNVTGYSWRLNGNPIGQTTATMSRTPFAITDTGTYTVVMTGNSPCPNVTSANAKVDPTTAAVITTEPAASTDICLGNNITLTVAASAQQSYQWRKNGVNIVGQTGTSFTISSAAYADAATYDVIAIAFNGCTNDTSIGAVVSVKTPLAITSPLATTDVKCEGQAISYTTGVSGDGPFTYTWLLNGSSVGTNSATYTKTSVLTADSGRYIVTIQGSMACPALRDTIDIDVNKAPQIVTQPNGASPVCLGNNIILTAAAVNQTALEWHKQGVGSLTQSGTSYTSSGSTTADAGNYFVIARAQPACSDVTSSLFNVVINIPAIIASQPVGMDLLETPAGSHTMFVIASGTGPLSYQWYKNGVMIPTATASSFAITNYVAAADSGLYYCEVKSPAPCSNTVLSSIAKIATVKCPVIMFDTLRAVNICAGRPFSLDVKATGALSYQWFRNNVAIPNANFANYSIPAANPAHTGVYRCRVFAFNEAICTPTYTDSIVVTVKDKPSITMQPEPIRLCAASTHTMRVAATFGETYQWYRNGIAISPNGDKDSFTYNNVNTLGDVFYVEVGNNLCPSTNSKSVTLKSIIPANQVFLANNSEFNLIERCSDANGWTYYSNTTQTERLLLAIKKNGNFITAKPDIELMNGIRELSSINTENRGAILGGRIFNLDITGTIQNAYELKFYYNKSEGDAVLARLNDIKLANPGQFSTDRIDLSFLLTTQQPFTSSLWNNLSIPLNTPHTISQKDKEFGVENGVNFVTLKNLVSTKLGGTLFMDFTLKASSRISSTNSNGFGFSLYPVPTIDGKVTVDVSSKRLKPISFTVTDMTGRIVAIFNEKHTSLESSHIFDFSQLANGNYQLLMTNDEESAIGRFTISK